MTMHGPLNAKLIITRFYESEHCGRSYLRNCVGVYKKHISIQDNNIVQIKDCMWLDFYGLGWFQRRAVVNSVTNVTLCIPCIRV